MILELLFVVAVGALPFDMLYIVLSANSINGKRHTNHWETLLLTNIKPEVVVEAEIARLQISSWWVVGIEIAIRMAILARLVFVVLLPYDVLLRVLNGADIIELSGVVWRHWRSLPWPLLVIVGYTIWYALIGEALWRMRAVTALGMARSARFNQPVSAVIAAVVTWVGIRVLLLFFLAPVGIFTTFSFVSFPQLILSAPFLQRTFILLGWSCVVATLSLASYVADMVVYDWYAGATSDIIFRVD